MSRPNTVLLINAALQATGFALRAHDLVARAQIEDRDVTDEEKAAVLATDDSAREQLVAAIERAEQAG